MSDPVEDPFDAADRLFIAERSLTEAAAAGPSERLDVGTLHAFLTDPGRIDTDRLTRLLFGDPRARRDLAALRDRMALVRLPALAAASTDEALEERRFPGGVLTLVPARRGGQLYLSIRFDEPVPQGPLVLLVEGPGEDLARMPLPGADAEGALFAILDLADPGQASVAALLARPDCSATLLPAGEGR